MVKKILGVKIDDVSQAEAVERVVGWLSQKSGSSSQRLAPRIIVTPGPEFLLTAQKDQEFRDILSQADLSIPDGFGLSLYGGVKNVVHGVDLMRQLCKEAEDKKWSVGLLGGSGGVAKKAAEVLVNEFAGMRVIYALDGELADDYLRYYGVLDQVTNISDRKLKKLPIVDLLFVGLGHPKQEKFLAAVGEEIRSGLRAQSFQRADYKLPVISYKVGMGVGGSFDLISGVLPRAPKFMRDLSLEWLWRMVTKPGHWRRVMRAALVFPILVIWDKLRRLSW